ncbi:uncharacterized protein PG986_011680 [Apiospora aurea]|uniref:Apple domain-containing protein n=1 Tax=Apiospora aurea TaxID=335848 RepID=A0ABR1PXU9_9PEZI
MPLPALLEHRQSGSPCPGANGGQIGTLRQYNVLCGSRLAGKEIGGQQTASLGDCVDLCNDHAGPRCDGVVYQSNGHCVLQAGINKGATTLDAGADSAIAAGMLQKPSSSCAALGSGTIQSANGVNFQITCRKVMSGNDFEVQFQMSFEDCMRACAKDGRCGGVSFEASQSFGFKNCYLKTPFSATSNQILDQPSIDTARLTGQQGNGNGNDNGQANQPPPLPPPQTTMMEVTKTIVTSAPATIAITTTGTDLATGGGIATVPGDQTRTLTTLVATTITAKPIQSGGASGKTQGSLAPGSSAAGEATDSSEEADVSSMLQIAGPVAGAVAFLGIVGFAIFFFCRRRRRRRGQRQRHPRGEKGRWADLGDGREDGGSSIWRDTTTTATTEVRDSRNGLKLNRVSTHAYGDPGIPCEFEGPHALTK